MRGLARAAACVAPKLIANGESHALERSSPARISGLGSHMAVKRAGEERKEADWSEAGARATGETRYVLPPEMQECPRGTMEESTLADSIDSACGGGTVCACSDTDAR